MGLKKLMPRRAKQYLKGVLGLARREADISNLRQENAALREENAAVRSALARYEDPRYFDLWVRSSLPVRVQGRPGPVYPQCEMTVRTDAGAVTEVLHTSYLCLAKVVTEYDFDTVLDIGSGQGSATRIFRHLGKKVSAVEIVKDWEADYRCDYLDVRLPGQVDLIWCSHTLEHQRNVGVFLEKTFRDLKDGGILALTVPDKFYDNLILGHCNVFNTLLLLYNLICAGYDCRNAVARTYDGNLSVIVRKVPNGLDRTPFALVPFDNPAGGGAEVGHLQDVFQFFPIPVTDYMRPDVPEINWPR